MDKKESTGTTVKNELPNKEEHIEQGGPIEGI